MSEAETIRLSRWWMGGVAAAAACCFTQPIDTIKVHMQTQHTSPRLSMYQLTMKMIREDGFMALNNGLSAAVMRQLTYSTVRFAFYEECKHHLTPGGEHVPVYQKIGIAAVGGAMGGFVGNPFDVINVRMQNDTTYPLNKRRNYKHVFDGLIRLYREEGVKRMFAGASVSVGRAVGQTIGQLVFYDQCKQVLMEQGGMKDNLGTHFAASTFAGAAATTLTQPMDVIKTLAMNAKPGQFKNMWHIVKFLGKQGPLAFYKVFPNGSTHNSYVCVLRAAKTAFRYYPSEAKEHIEGKEVYQRLDAT